MYWRPKTPVKESLEDCYCYFGFIHIQGRILNVHFYRKISDIGSDPEQNILTIHHSPSKTVFDKIGLCVKDQYGFTSRITNIENGL